LTQRYFKIALRLLKLRRK